MGWQTPVTGDVRMSAASARELLALGHIDWYEPDQTFAEYVGGGVGVDDANGVVRFDLGWVTWRLPPMMNLIAAVKDTATTDELFHHAPTYDAWHATGTFFIEPGRWSYVGAGPMFNVERGSYERPAHVGPERPTLADVRDWHVAGPLARSAHPSDDGVWLEVETMRNGAFRCGIWCLGVAHWSEEVLDTVALADGGASLVFIDNGRDVSVPVRRLYELREVPNT